MQPYMRSHTWSPRPGINPALYAVGDLRIPLRGRASHTRRDCWVLDYSFIAGTYYRLSARGPWPPRLAGEGHLYAPRTTFWSKSDPSFHLVSQSRYVMFGDNHALELESLFRNGERYGCFFDPQGLLGRRLRVLVGIGVKYCEAGFRQAQAALWRLIDLLFRQSLAAPDGTRTIVPGNISSADMDFVARVDRYLRDHMTAHLTRSNIARSLGVSVSTLAHRYRNLTGISPIQRLLCIRIEAAKTLLRHGQPLKTIAAATGCGDPVYLSKLFKSIVGQTPQQYLNAARGKAPDD